MEEIEYLVVFHVDATGSIKVKAKTVEEAKQLAWDEFLPGVDNTEFGDPQDIVDVVVAAKKERLKD